ncbi:MAG: pyridoxal-phosphate-dependent aminotransferase family protein [Planctomycetota bacterium]|jgi:aspartate aminotransferase-like enzyme
MQKKYLLFAPGPTTIPPEVSLSMAEPIIHHRAPAFVKVLEEVREGLKYLFQTKNEVLLFASTGTGAMEGAVTNTLSAGDKAIVVDGGKFGERWGQICKAYGINTDIIPIEWGQAVEPELLQKKLQADPEVRAVFIQASETSTGVAYPVKAIAEIVKNFENTILVVDAITGLGVFDLPTDKWNLDIVVGGSQKALMLPPGLAFAAVSDKAWKHVEQSTLPKYYFDFKKELKNLQKNQSAYTAAVSLVVGLRESLRQIREESLEKVFARTDTLARAIREAMKALGLQLFAPASPSNAVTAVCAPSGVNGQDVVKILREKHNITIAGGQDQAKGKIFRISHMGYMDSFDIVSVGAAVEMTLNELGYQVELGKGVQKALEVLKERM